MTDHTQLPTPPVDGVPIAAVRHVILAVPPISIGANMAFMLAALLAWSLEPVPTIGELTSHRPRHEWDDLVAGARELAARDFAFIDPDDRLHLLTGVPGCPPPPAAEEVWHAMDAWVESQPSGGDEA